MAAESNMDKNSKTRTGGDQHEVQVSPDELQQRRKRARRTALILGAVVLAIFATFIYTGVVGRG